MVSVTNACRTAVTCEEADQLWVTGITEHPTRDGKVYQAHGPRLRRVQYPESVTSRTRPGPGAARLPSRRWPRTAFWGHRLHQQFVGPPVNGQLGPDLGDPAPAAAKLRVLGRRQFRRQ